MGLEERVEKLERQLGRLRAVAVGLGLALSATLLAGAIERDAAVQEFQIIRARDLLIVNGQGQIMCSVGEDGEGNGRLVLGSRTDKQVFVAGADERGNGQLLISSSTDQGVFSALVDADGNGRLLIGSSTQRPLVSAGADKRGNGQFLLLSAAEKPALSAGVDGEDHGGVVGLYNRAGQEVVQLGCDPQGSGIVGAYDPQGAGRALKPKP